MVSCFMDPDNGINEHIIHIDTPSDISENSIEDIELAIPLHPHPVTRNENTIDQQYSEHMNSKLDEIRTQFITNQQNDDLRGSGSNNTSVFMHHDNNSPLSLSDGEMEDDQPFRKLSYQEVEQSIDKYYDDTDNKYSSELDILITYMKGQKNLFIQAYLISQRKLNCLLIPALLITSVVTIFTPIVENYQWNAGVISGLNALTTILIALSNYLKLETSTQTFYTTASQFEKLETSLEFVASKLMFVDTELDKSHVVFEKVQEVEQKIAEIREWNTLFLPDDIRKMFPIICNINIFSFIKRMESNKKMLIARFKDVKNEIRYIMHCKSRRRKDQKRIGQRLSYLNETKEKIKDELGHYRNAYGHIDDLFTVEIRTAQNSQGVLQFLKKMCGFHQNAHCGSDYSKNPVIDKYIHAT